MKLIPLTQGKFAQVDDEDFEKVSVYKWFASKRNNKDDVFTAERNTRIVEGPQRQKIIKMHRFILQEENPNIKIDHIDHNPLNNQRNNLRRTTQQQNLWNQRSRKGSSSSYLGVYKKIQKYKGKKKISLYYWWAAEVCADGVKLHLGNFPYTPEGEIEAAKSYDLKAKELFGEFVNLNFKDQLTCQTI